MKTELTTPKAILIGMSLIAVAVASIPYSKSVVGDAHAANRIQRVEICGSDYGEYHCARISGGGYLYTSK